MKFKKICLLGLSLFGVTTATLSLTSCFEEEDNNQTLIVEPTEQENQYFTVKIYFDKELDSSTIYYTATTLDLTKINKEISGKEIEGYYLKYDKDLDEYSDKILSNSIKVSSNTSIYVKYITKLVVKKTSLNFNEGLFSDFNAYSFTNKNAFSNTYASPADILIDVVDNIEKGNTNKVTTSTLSPDEFAIETEIKLKSPITVDDRGNPLTQPNYDYRYLALVYKFNNKVTYTDNTFSMTNKTIKTVSLYELASENLNGNKNLICENGSMKNNFSFDQSKYTFTNNYAVAFNSSGKISGSENDTYTYLDDIYFKSSFASAPSVKFTSYYNTANFGAYHFNNTLSEIVTKSTKKINYNENFGLNLNLESNNSTLSKIIDHLSFATDTAYESVGIEICVNTAPTENYYYLFLNSDELYLYKYNPSTYSFTKAIEMTVETEYVSQSLIKKDFKDFTFYHYNNVVASEISLISTMTTNTFYNNYSFLNNIVDNDEYNIFSSMLTDLIKSLFVIGD